MSGSISPLLKDTSFGVDPATGLVNPQLLAELNADQRVRTFFVEVGTTITAGQWVSIDTATNTFGLGNSVLPLNLGAAPTALAVGVALDGAAPVASDSIWIRVVTRGVTTANCGVTAVGDLLSPSVVAGEAITPALPAIGDLLVGYALELTAVAAPITCYVTCE
jgi:hypothetical protein